VLNAFFRVISFLAAQQPGNIVNVSIPESLPGDAQSFDDTFSVHNISFGLDTSRDEQAGLLDHR
jgi:hypothetical protein